MLAARAGAVFYILLHHLGTQMEGKSYIAQREQAKSDTWTHMHTCAHTPAHTNTPAHILPHTHLYTPTHNHTPTLIQKLYGVDTNIERKRKWLIHKSVTSASKGDI